MRISTPTNKEAVFQILNRIPFEKERFRSIFETQFLACSKKKMIVCLYH